MNLLCSVQELKQVLRDVPEIVEVVGSTDVEKFIRLDEQEKEKAKSLLQSIFTKLMSASADIVALAVSQIKSRLELESQVIPEVRHILFLNYNPSAFLTK